MAEQDVPRALDGVVVLDVTQVMAGSYCGLLLADLGADVIKVERPRIGDLTRWAGDSIDAFRPLNRNKRGIAVDLGVPAGADVLRRLATTADVLVENHRPGAMARHGVGYADLSAINPRLIYCSISGFGNAGPLAGLGGLDLMAQGMSGIMSLTGEPGRAPCKVGVPIADLNAGVFATVGVLAALHHRGATGVGQEVTTSLLAASVAYTVWESMLLFQAGMVAEPGGSAHRLTAPYEALPTADGWITVAAPQPAMYAALCDVVGRPDLVDDERFAKTRRRLANRELLAAELAGALAGRTTSEWCELLGAAGVPCGPVHRMDDVVADAQVLANELVVDDVEGGGQPLGAPLAMSVSPMRVRRGAPKLGEHTRDVLVAAGYDESAIDELLAAGAVEEPAPA